MNCGLLQKTRWPHVLVLRHAAPPRGRELPPAADQRTKKPVASNQRDGQMAYRVDLAPGQNPHVNYEPSS
jgi:catalase